VHYAATYTSEQCAKHTMASRAHDDQVRVLYIRHTQDGISRGSFDQVARWKKIGNIVRRLLQEALAVRDALLDGPT
jgi:hypothetical protein